MERVDPSIKRVHPSIQHVDPSIQHVDPSIQIPHLFRVFYKIIIFRFSLQFFTRTKKLTFLKKFNSLDGRVV